MPSRVVHPIQFRNLLLPIVLLWIASVAIRWVRFDERAVAANISASHHVLLTVEALNRTPVAVHHMLPIVTLGRTLDREVPFGASVRAPNGIYYYTSFPPLGFIAPWAFFQTTHLAPTVANLMVFNFAIHLAATLLLALLVVEVLARAGADASMQRIVAAIAGATYLFAYEAAYSHGLVYWHHSLFQVAWLAQLVAAARVFHSLDDGTAPNRLEIGLLLTASFLAPSIEWSGYLSGAAIAGALWWSGRRERRGWALALATLAATAAAGVVLIAQFASVVGLEPLIAALGERAGARSVVHGSLMSLVAGYAESFGWYLLLAGAVLAAYVIQVRRAPPAWASRILVVATIPLVENVVLAEHATIYTYDRLKALVVVVLVLALFIAFLSSSFRDRALFLWMAAVVAALVQPGPSRVWPVNPPLESNTPLFERLRAVARPCAVYGMNNISRAWVDLSLGANVYESIPGMDSLRRIVAARGACQGIYLRVGRDLSESIYLWRFATVYDAATGVTDSIPGVEPRRPRLAVPAE
jgi:hypothetical protein